MARFVCQICDDPDMAVSWTDTHGVAQCLRCGAPYRIYHYEGDKRVEKPHALAVKPEYVGLLRRYWHEHSRRAPSGYSLANYGGQYERATDEDARLFYEWMNAQPTPDPIEVAPVPGAPGRA